MPHQVADSGKFWHEVRDPIHTFILLTSEEREIIGATALQRLRYIHQLATTYLIYPGATHRRFEHSLGVMEIATRIFDRVIRAEQQQPATGGVLQGLRDEAVVGYWRNVLRAASLCHDIGHLPFSHAAEADLLPAGVDHESITRLLLETDPLARLLSDRTPPLALEDVVWVSVGAKAMGGVPPRSPWVELLSEILTGDWFGADRIDYLLRDAYHTGVAYGRFDHYRLIDTLRVLPLLTGDDEEPTGAISIGMEEGGIQSMEALLLARYFMFSQVYFHHVRRIYDIHLKDFLTAWLEGGRFDVDRHLDLTDNEVLVAIRQAAGDVAAAGHDPARRFLGREHFRLLYQPDPADSNAVVSPGEVIAEAASAEPEIGSDAIRYDAVFGKTGAVADFSVLRRDRTLVPVAALSKVMGAVPAASVEYVFVAPERREAAEEWLRRCKRDVLENARTGANEEEAAPPSDPPATITQ